MGCTEQESQAARDGLVVHTAIVSSHSCLLGHHLIIFVRLFLKWSGFLNFKCGKSVLYKYELTRLQKGIFLDFRDFQEASILGKNITQ